MFSAMLQSQDFNQLENMASFRFLNLLLVNAPWNDFTALLLFLEKAGPMAGN